MSENSIDNWLVFLDLDGTFWDHLDVSTTTMPFKKISENAISDSNGVILTLHEGILDFTEWVRRNGGILSSCSWNEPQFAIEALKTFGAYDRFNYHMISSNPRKDLLMKELIDKLKIMNFHIKEKRIFYIDDRDIHIKEIRGLFPEITFIQIWKDASSFQAVKDIILSKLR